MIVVVAVVHCKIYLNLTVNGALLLCYRQKLDDVGQSKETELAALRQHVSNVEQQLANSNLVSCIFSLPTSLVGGIVLPC